MNWNWFYREPPLPPAARGRIGRRLVRGIIWALIAIFIISILAFLAGQALVPEPHHIRGL